MSPLRRLVFVIVAVVVAVTAVAGCQVSTNDEPVAVGPIFDDLLNSTTTSSSPSTTDGATKPVTVYFLRTSDAGERFLVGVPRSVAVDAQPLQVLTNLFDQRPDPTERLGEANLTSAIPQSAELLSAEIAPGSSTLVVDTTGLLGADGTVGPASRDAAAQIVFTATGLQGVDAVTFLNDGSEPTGVLIGSGEVVERPVTRVDYENLVESDDS